MRRIAAREKLKTQGRFTKGFAKMIQSLKPYVPVNARLGDVADYDGLLLRLGARDRAAIEKHIAVCETEPTLDHAKLCKHAACLLCNFLPQACPTPGLRTA